MPYPFVPPTTSAFSYSSSFTCDSHPSLPLTASTHRGVVRDTLKKHKRLPPSAQPSNLPTIASALTSYLPYLLAVDAGISNRPIGDGSELFSIIQRASPSGGSGLGIEWRPTLSDVFIPGKRENARVKVHALEHEVAFVFATHGYVSTLLARAALQPLYSTTTSNQDLYAIGSTDRQTAIATATKHLLDAAGVYDHLARRAEQPRPSHAPPPPCADVGAATARAQAHLALAEATLLAVLKDDPYPAVVAQDRNQNDREWMYKAPDVPKVRAHLFARLCLAAAEHAAMAHSLCAWQTGPPVKIGTGLRLGSKKKGSVEGEEDVGAGGGGGGGSGKLNEGFVRYLEDLRRTSRAKACRFFGIDAELGGQTGNAIGWLHAGLQELGVETKDPSKKSSGLNKLKKEWTEKREDRRVEKGTTWGADGGKLEETRIIEVLESKWAKQNDTVRPQGPISHLSRLKGMLTIPESRCSPRPSRPPVPCSRRCPPPGRFILSSPTRCRCLTAARWRRCAPRRTGAMTLATSRVLMTRRLCQDQRQVHTQVVLRHTTEFRERDQAASMREDWLCLVTDDGANLPAELETPNTSRTTKDKGRASRCSCRYGHRVAEPPNLRLPRGRVLGVHALLFSEILGLRRAKVHPDVNHRWPVAGLRTASFPLLHRENQPGVPRTQIHTKRCITRLFPSSSDNCQTVRVEQPQ